VTAQAEQADEHDDEQEHVRSKEDDHCQFGDLDVQRVAWGARSFTCMAKLSEGLVYNV